MTRLGRASGDGGEAVGDTTALGPLPPARPSRVYRQASPPAHGGIRRAGGIRPWADLRERRALAVFDRIDRWVTRAGWLLVLLAALWLAAVAARLP